MKITAGILFYLLDRYGNMQHICHGADRMELKRFEHFRNQKITEAGVLYIFSDKKGVLLFCGEKKYKPSFILMNALKEKGGTFSSLWIPYANLDEGAKKNSHLADEVSEYTGQIWNSFSLIQNEILELILNQERVEDVMEQVRGLLREPFVVVDRDMLLLYQHPDVPRLMEKEIGSDYQKVLEEEFLVSKEFHEVAKKKEPFYYAVENMKGRQYCINIVADGYYYARLVVYVPENEEKLSSGAEQLTEYLAGVLVQMIRGGGLQVNKNQNDQLHMICQNILNDIEPETIEIRKALSPYQWEENHAYQVLCLEPYQASGWETQIENTMPVMTRKLEQGWSNSCAVFSGEKILWIINRTLADGTEKPNKRDQKLMVLLRENVFRAGASSIFNNVTMIADAFREAEEALQLGTKKESSYWYFSFDDYRLTYMINAIREKGIAPMVLVHPAIPVLMQYDQSHESQLTETLKMLAEKQGNMTQTADALFIHRTTLFRRLNQVKELTGLDLNDPDLLLELQISYRILG